MLIIKLKKVLKHFMSLFMGEINIFRRSFYQKKIQKQFQTLQVVKSSEGYKSILVDSTWQNPNHWLRLNLIIKALSLKSSKMTGLLGQYNRRSILRTLMTFDIRNYADTKRVKSKELANKELAKKLIEQSQNPKDILNWKLPEQVPPKFLYDSLLKKTNRPTINLKDKKLVLLVAEEIHKIHIAKEIFNNSNFDLYLCSHTIGTFYGSLAWIAIKNKINVICIRGDLGTIRFEKINNLSQLNGSPNAYPSKEDFNTSLNKELKLIKSGSMYLKKRISGKSKDLAAKIAFSKDQPVDKQEIINHFNWPKGRKIITVYGQNWTDYPHSLNIKNFVDFKDWFDTTLNVAIRNKEVLWLFKEHPLTERYNTKEEYKISFYINKLNIHHIKVVPDNWSAKDVMKSTDCIITACGSIAFEFSGLGKPALIADRGLYKNYGFGLVANNKSHYIRLLNTPWWKKINLDKSKLNAFKFIGFRHSIPSWQNNLIYEDDHSGDQIYSNLDNFLKLNLKDIENEIYFIRKWHKSQVTSYHNYKILTSDDLDIGNANN